MDENQIGTINVDCAVQLHQAIGPGLLDRVAGGKAMGLASGNSEQRIWEDTFLPRRFQNAQGVLFTFWGQRRL